MTGNGGEALELALGLLRAPALRASLRARPLPDGVGEVLTIASGSSEAIRAAAHRTGYGEGEVIEAARFYVQQVLLAEDADAYRILGTHRGADRVTLRDHHHLLLRWLHPDRSDADAQWDSALATRVNQAWNQLRGSDARARYDAALDALDGAATAAATAAAPAPILRHPPMPQAEAPSPSRVAPIAVAALGVACVALAWLALQREDRPDAASAASARSAPVASPPASLPEPPPEAPRLAPLAPLLVMPAAETELAPDPAPSAPPVHDAVTADAFAQDRPAPGATEADRVPTASFMPARQAPASTLESATAPTAVVAPRQTPPPPWPTTAPPVPAVALAHAATAAPRQPNPLPLDDAPPAAQPPSAPAVPTATLVAASAQPPAPEPAVDEDPLLLMRQAEAAVLAVTRYLAAQDGPPPAWRDAPTGHAAADIRRRLLARNDGPVATHLALQSPNWTLGTRDASVLGPYRLDDRQGLLETGFLHVELARYGRQWRVAAVRLDPSP